MVVSCIRRCFCSKRARRYYPGDQDDIDPLEPVAMYFSFPPGTEVYHKSKNKHGKLIQGTKTVPGFIEKPESVEPVNCEYCGRQCKSKVGLIAHMRHCEAALTAGKTDADKEIDESESAEG